MFCLKYFLVLLLICMYTAVVYCQGPLSLLREILQNNLAGEPLLHKSVEYPFDPEISQKRRELFYEQHGFRAAKLIERKGVGVDGKEEQRRQEQAIRDIGKLNGEHVFNFP